MLLGAGECRWMSLDINGISVDAGHRLQFIRDSVILSDLDSDLKSHLNSELDSDFRWQILSLPCVD